MGDYVLSCCSTADLSLEHIEKRDLKFVCFRFEIDGENYPDDLGKSISLDEFYKRMENGAMTRTSQVNVEEYMEYFESFLKEGKDILHLTLSSGISGAYNSACVARDEMEEKYPDRKIYVVDSLCASSGFGLLMDKLADLRDEGMGIDELNEWVIKNRTNLQHWFFTSELKYLVRGGRVSKTAGAVGAALNICPLLNVNCEGKLIARAKIRTKKKVMRAAVDKMEERAVAGKDYAGKCFISQAACYEDARMVADMIEERFPNLNGGVEIFNIGTTIGSHTGPGTVAIFFWGDEREV